MATITLTPVGSNNIEAIRAHLAAGNHVAIVTAARTTVLSAKHAGYIHADGTGYALGWTGKRKVWTPAYQVGFVPAGYRV
jgi:hypothetical protein